MNEKTETPGTKEIVVVEDHSEFEYLLDTAKFEHIRKIAELFAASDLVPKHYKKLSNCVIALQTAFRMKIDPMMYMQKSYIVHEKPGIEASLAIALLNRSGKIKGTIQYEFKGAGPTRQCTASAIETETGNRHEMTITWAQVVANGWLKNEHWKINPDLMLTYRSAMWLTRTRWPEVILGMLSYEELQDTSPGPIIRDVTPRKAETADDEDEVELVRLHEDLVDFLGVEKDGQPGYSFNEQDKTNLRQFIKATAEAGGYAPADIYNAVMVRPDDFMQNFLSWPGRGRSAAPDGPGDTNAPGQGVGLGQGGEVQQDEPPDPEDPAPPQEEKPRRGRPPKKTGDDELPLAPKEYPKLTTSEVSSLMTACATAGIGPADLCAEMEVPDLSQIRQNQINQCLEAIEHLKKQLGV